MRKPTLILDWITYVLIIIIFAFVFSFGLVFISHRSEIPTITSMQKLLMLTYEISRVIVIPVFLAGFLLDRFLDGRIRANPFIIKFRNQPN